MELKQLNKLECPNCGASLDTQYSVAVLECPYCGSQFQNPNAANAAPAAAASVTPAPKAPSRPVHIPSPDEYPGIVHNCINKHAANSAYILMGDKLDKTNRRYRSAYLEFRIPPNEECYLILDATVFGTCKAGFAVCAGGVYFKPNAGDTSLGTQFLPWNEFIHTKVTVEGGNLLFDHAGFNAAGDAAMLRRLFTTIQKSLTGQG